MWSASTSEGGLVWGVTQSSLTRRPIVRASRTSTQPDVVFHVVLITPEPGSYERALGCEVPKGPSRNNPAPRSSTLPKMLGESNRGTHNHSTEPSEPTSAPVWQFDKKA